jgi:outer membrane protein assembly factor BamE
LLHAHLYQPIARQNLSSLAGARDTPLHRLRRRASRWLIGVVALGCIAGCSAIRFPGVHRVIIHQGNLVSQTMVDRLRPGMTKSQVRYVLGNPIIDDSLNQDRWEYINTLQVSGRKMIQRSLVVHFRDNRLSFFEGNYRDVPPASASDQTRKEDPSDESADDGDANAAEGQSAES